MDRRSMEDVYAGGITTAAVWLAFYLLALATAVAPLIAPDAVEVAAPRQTLGQNQIVRKVDLLESSERSLTVQIHR